MLTFPGRCAELEARAKGHAQALDATAKSAAKEAIADFKEASERAAKAEASLLSARNQGRLDSSLLSARKVRKEAPPLVAKNDGAHLIRLERSARSLTPAMSASFALCSLQVKIGELESALARGAAEVESAKRAVEAAKEREEDLLAQTARCPSGLRTSLFKKGI